MAKTTKNGTKKGPKEGLNGPRPTEKIPKNAIFQNPIQNNSFSEIFTWVEAVRKNPPAELFIFGPRFSPMALYVRAQLSGEKENALLSSRG
jgi:hypothetical protein